MQKIDIIGFLGGNAEGKFTPNGKYFMWVNVAVSRSYTDANGQKVETTTWYRAFSSFKNEPTGLMKHLVKGAKVFMTGELQAELSEYNGKPSLDLGLFASKIIPLTFVDSTK